MEVCPEAGVVIQELSQRISLTGGAALIADYGHDGTKTDTFRVCIIQSHDLSEFNWYSLLSCHMLGLKFIEDMYLTLVSTVSVFAALQYFIMNICCYNCP